jgi:hypothetical protein
MADILSELKKTNKSVENQNIMPSTPLMLKRLAAEDGARYIYENFPQVQVFIHRHETVDGGEKLLLDLGLTD